MSEVIQTPKKPRRVGDGTPGPGRPKGSQNKTTVAVKQALAEAFEGIGGVSALITWAREQPGEFYKLWGRMLPLEANLHHDGQVTLEQLITKSLEPK
jgi:hypothetical protein